MILVWQISDDPPNSLNSPQLAKLFILRYTTNVQSLSSITGSLPLINPSPLELRPYQWQAFSDLGPRSSIVLHT